jgi:hypothetical protein
MAGLFMCEPMSAIFLIFFGNDRLLATPFGAHGILKILVNNAGHGTGQILSKAVRRHDGSRVHLAEHPGGGLP